MSKHLTSIIILIATILTSFSANAQEEAANDTIKRWDFTLTGLGFGMNNALDTPDGMEVKMGKSFEINWLYVLGARYNLRDGRSSLNFGLGLDWRNYSLAKPVRFISGDGCIGYGPYPEGVTPKKSRLKVFSITLPLLFDMYIPYGKAKKHHTGFYLGGVINFNVHGTILSQWVEPNGDKTKLSGKNAYPRKCTFDFLGGVRLYNNISWYLKYSPMKLLKEGSPQFTTLSTGLMLGF